MNLHQFCAIAFSRFNSNWQVSVVAMLFIKLHLSFILQLWQIHNAEQMILDDMTKNPDKYEGKKLSELSDDEDFDEENTVEYGQAYFKGALIPRMTLVIFF